MGLIEKNTTIGDCVYIDKDSPIPKLNKYYHNQMLFHGEAVTKFRIDDTPMFLPQQTKCFQARHDILMNLPVFLVHYINLPQLEFSESMKKEAKILINPITDRCVSLLEQDYTISPYYSNEFARQDIKTEPAVYLCKGLPINDIQSDFLKILGRYYFLISNKFSTEYEIDSSDEQRTITGFTINFFPNPNLESNEIYSSLDDDDKISNYFSDDHTRLTPTEFEAFDEIKNKNVGGKFATRYEYYGHNDTFIVADYYLKWILGLNIFSSIEKKMIQMNFEQSEQYEDESKDTEHDDKYEDFSRPFKKEIKGELRSIANGKAALILSRPYREVEPYLGRWTKILIEEKESWGYFRGDDDD